MSQSPTESPKPLRGAGKNLKCGLDILRQQMAKLSPKVCNMKMLLESEITTIVQDNDFQSKTSQKSLIKNRRRISLSFGQFCRN